jgi:hypothetical protein
MVGELDRHETADAVKCFCFGVERCCGEPSSTGRGRTRPLNRILEAAQMRREPKRALSEQNERWGAVLEQLYEMLRVMRALGPRCP